MDYTKWNASQSLTECKATKYQEFLVKNTTLIITNRWNVQNLLKIHLLFSKTHWLCKPHQQNAKEKRCFIGIKTLL